MLTQYVIAFCVTALTHFILAVLIYAKGRHRLTNITYALYSVAISWWSGLEAVAVTRVDAQVALFWWRFNHIGVIFIPVFFVHFVISLLEPYQQLQKRRIVRAVYLFGIICLILDATPILIGEVVPKFSFNFFINPGLIYHVFFGLWVSLAVYGLIELFKIYVTSTRAKRNQLTYFCWSMFVAYLGGIPNFLPTFNIELPYLMPFGTYAIPLYALATAYAIVRYRLMDINVAITRAGVFMGAHVVLLFAPLGVAVAWETQLRRVLAGENWWLWMWGVAAGLTVIAYYVNLHFQHRAEEKLFRQQRKYQQALQAASLGMTQIREVKRLVGVIVYVVTRTVSLSQAAIFLADPRTGVFTLGACRFRRSMSPVHRLSRENPLMALLGRTRQPVVLDELKAQFGEPSAVNGKRPMSVPEQAIAQMEALRASVVIPSFRLDRLMGFLLLGEKLNRQLFTTEDLIVFSVLANQAAVAVENARFYEANQQRQEAVFHTASLASLGMMASSMGHQVNNRFNVISVVASSQKMRIEELLKREEQDPATLRHAVEECLAELKSLQEEALRGGEVVSAIRKITSASREGYQMLSINTAIEAGFDVVRYKARFEEFDVRREIPEDAPSVYGDLAQLGECFLNLIDNAYDAIVERIEKLKPEPYQGRIAIKAWAEPTAPGGGWLAIEVSDNGIGILDKERGQLFTPFFTTKLSSDKGTGLGLYVIKRIIESHGGTITLDSTYGVGTTFTLRLPLVSPHLPAASVA